MEEHAKMGMGPDNVDAILYCNKIEDHLGVVSWQDHYQTWIKYGE